MKTCNLSTGLQTITLFLVLSGLFKTGYAQGDFAKNKQTLKNTREYIEAKKYIDSLVKNNNIYYGEGTALIGNDIGKAIEQARKRAQSNLAEKIKVQVRSTIQQMVQSNMNQFNGSFSEQIEESFKEQTNIYTEQVLTDLNISPNFINYPDSGSVTIAVFIDKALYKKRIRDDIESKKTLIRGIIKNGEKAYYSGHYTQAVKDWLLALERLYDFFQNIPLQDNLGEHPSLQDVSSYINGRITLLFSGLRLANISGETWYDAKGRLNKPVMIYAKYKDEYGKENPVSDLPLTANFIRGDGEILKGIITGTYGQATLQISYLNPANQSTLIKITVDTARIKGLSGIRNLLIPTLDIPINKVRTVAMAVTFNNNGHIASPENLKNTIRTELLTRGLATVNLFINTENVKDVDITDANNNHADYLFYIHIKATGSSTVGGYENIYITTCTGTVFIYELPQGQLINSQPLPTFNGYGSSSINAGLNGFNKMQKAILKATNTILERIK